MQNSIKKFICIFMGGVVVIAFLIGWNLFRGNKNADAACMQVLRGCRVRVVTSKVDGPIDTLSDYSYGDTEECTGTAAVYGTGGASGIKVCIQCK